MSFIYIYIYIYIYIALSIAFFRIKFTALQLYRKICFFYLSEYLVIQIFVKTSIFTSQISEKPEHVFARLTPHKCRQTFHISKNLLGKKTWAKEKCINQLYSVFFINIIKDLQCINPPKICMECYLNTASKRNSTISLITYENWCPQDDNSFRLCVRLIVLCKRSLGKIENTSKNYQKGHPSLSKLLWSQEDLDMLSAP